MKKIIACSPFQTKFWISRDLLNMPYGPRLTVASFLEGRDIIALSQSCRFFIKDRVLYRSLNIPNEFHSQNRSLSSWITNHPIHYLRLNDQSVTNQNEKKFNWIEDIPLYNRLSNFFGIKESDIKSHFERFTDDTGIPLLCPSVYNYQFIRSDGKVVHVNDREFANKPFSYKTIDLPEDVSVRSIHSTDVEFATILTNDNIIDIWSRKADTDTSYSPLPLTLGSRHAEHILKEILQIESADNVKWALKCKYNKERSIQSAHSTEKEFLFVMKNNQIQICNHQIQTILSPKKPISAVYSNKIQFLVVFDNGKSISILPPTKNLEDYSEPDYNTLPEGSYFKTIYANDYSFLPILNNGLPATKEVPKGRSIKAIHKTQHFFLATLDNNSIVFLTVLPRMNHRLLDPPKIPEGRSIKLITSSPDAIVAVLDNGELFGWGSHPGVYLTPLAEGRTIKSIYLNQFSFVAILDNNHHQTCDSSDFENILHLDEGRSIKTIVANDFASVATLDNKELHAWGHPNFGGTLPQSLKGKTVAYVTSYRYNFYAVLDDYKTIVKWGGCENTSHTFFSEKSTLKILR
jgi:hypothetical protein